MADIEKFFKKREEKKEEKKLIEYIKPVDESIKEKLHSMAKSGFGAAKPCLITIECITDAISEWKQEKQIYSQEITQSNCTELALSFRKILQISNLENLLNVHTLRLDNNMIMRIENLEKLKNIKWLDLSFNYISDIEGLDALENLADLSLYFNQITEVKNLDQNRKLNVLSIGGNRIVDSKVMVSYLRRFSSLQAICVQMNPFCKDDQVTQNISDQNQKITFPASYDVILEGLPKLKYLDWKPIDEDYRANVISNYKSNSKDEATAQDELNEEKRLEERAALHNANLDEIVDFFPKVIKKIQDDIEPDKWKRIIEIPGLDDKVKLLEKSINEEIEKYKKKILEIQVIKDKVIKQRQKEMDKNEEKFIDESKELIRDFKRTLKSFITSFQKGQTQNVKSTDEAVKLVGLDKIKNRLLEIEVYAKEKISEDIKNFKAKVGEENNKMQQETIAFKEQLDNHKNTFRDAIITITTSLKNDIDAENEKAEKMEGDKEGEVIDLPRDQKLEELAELFQSPDFNSDLEKLTEVLDDRIVNLRDQLENARNKTTEDFFNELKQTDYDRNKTRIQDIKEIYEIYWGKLDKVIQNAAKGSNDYAK